MDNELDFTELGNSGLGISYFDLSGKKTKDDYEKLKQALERNAQELIDKPHSNDLEQERHVESLVIASFNTAPKNALQTVINGVLVKALNGEDPFPEITRINKKKAGRPPIVGDFYIWQEYIRTNSSQRQTEKNLGVDRKKVREAMKRFYAIPEGARNGLLNHFNRDN